MTIDFDEMMREWHHKMDRYHHGGRLGKEKMETTNYDYEAILEALIWRVGEVPDKIVKELLTMHKEVGHTVSAEMLEQVKDRGMQLD